MLTLVMKISSIPQVYIFNFPHLSTLTSFIHDSYWTYIYPPQDNTTPGVNKQTINQCRNNNETKSQGRTSSKTTRNYEAKDVLGMLLVSRNLGDYVSILVERRTEKTKGLSGFVLMEVYAEARCGSQSSWVKRKKYLPTSYHQNDLVYPLWFYFCKAVIWLDNFIH